MIAPEHLEILIKNPKAVLKKIKQGEIKADKIGHNYVISRKNLDTIVFNELTDKIKKEVERGVARVVKEYGDVLKQLGEE